LDWSKPVGLIVYADGSGEYGLKNPRSTYLLAGRKGLVRVAKRNNMVLLTPFAPNRRCSDGGGSCWYLGDPVGYARWSKQLVRWVLGRYPIDRRRVAIGGCSSGAQWATQYFTPSGGAQRIQRNGVIVAISYGGAPNTTPVTFRKRWKQRVHLRWDVGSQDDAYRTRSSDGHEGTRLSRPRKEVLGGPYPIPSCRPPRTQSSVSTPRRSAAPTSTSSRVTFQRSPTAHPRSRRRVGRSPRSELR
jgi:hypothetical protein